MTSSGSVSESSSSGSAVMWQRLVVGLIVVALLIAAGLAVVQERRVVRDAKRVADIKQIMAGLVLYQNDHTVYPKSLEPGTPLSSPVDETVYIEVIPRNPQPGGVPYRYETADNNTTYTLTFVLETGIGTYEAGEYSATPKGIK